MIGLKLRRVERETRVSGCFCFSSVAENFIGSRDRPAVTDVPLAIEDLTDGRERDRIDERAEKCLTASSETRTKIEGKSILKKNRVGGNDGKDERA